VPVCAFLPRSHERNIPHHWNDPDRVNRLQEWDGLSLEAAEFEGGVMLCSDVSLRVTRTTTVLDEM